MTSINRAYLCILRAGWADSGYLQLLPDIARFTFIGGRVGLDQGWGGHCWSVGDSCAECTRNIYTRSNAGLMLFIDLLYFLVIVMEIRKHNYH